MVPALLFGMKRCAAPLALSLVLAPALPARALSDEPIAPIPLAAPDLDPRKVKLGEALFNDPQLSVNGTKACASCHLLEKGGEDGLAHSPTALGGLTAVHAPTIFNISLNFREFWDGRAATPQAQIDDVMTSRGGMANTWPALLATLAQDAEFVRDFQASYPAGLTRDTVTDALVTYEQTLVTPNSRFDQYLRGNKAALSEDEAAGYGLFKKYGCVACHQGENVGGNMFQIFGVFGAKGAYFAHRGNLTKADLGRFNVTGEEDDKYVFKVPSLRNIALRAPYFHDGSAATLEEAVNVMFQYQLGRSATSQDTALIVKFLDTLTGEYDGRPLGKPANEAAEAGRSE